MHNSPEVDDCLKPALPHEEQLPSKQGVVNIGLTHLDEVTNDLAHDLISILDDDWRVEATTCSLCKHTVHNCNHLEKHRVLHSNGLLFHQMAPAVYSLFQPTRRTVDNPLELSGHTLVVELGQKHLPSKQGSSLKLRSDL